MLPGRLRTDRATCLRCRVERRSSLSAWRSYCTSPGGSLHVLESQASDPDRDRPTPALQRIELMFLRHLIGAAAIGALALSPALNASQEKPQPPPKSQRPPS